MGFGVEDELVGDEFDETCVEKDAGACGVKASTHGRGSRASWVVC